MEPTEARRTRIAAAVRAEMEQQKSRRGIIAAAAGISPDKLRRRLNGERPFNIDEFVAICHALHVPVAEMLDRAGIK